jgi:hypothetical protein
VSGCRPPCPAVPAHHLCYDTLNPLTERPPSRAPRGACAIGRHLPYKMTLSHQTGVVGCGAPRVARRPPPPLPPLAMQTPFCSQRTLRQDAGLAAAFAMLDHPSRAWARDFVLGGWDSDPAGDVSALSNPVAMGQGDAADFFAAGKLPDDEEPTASMCASQCLWVPAWSGDGVVVGVCCDLLKGVSGFSGVPTMPSGGATVLTCGRFARDERTGETFVVSSELSASGCPSGSLVTVLYMRNESSTRRRHVFLQCDRAQLAWRPKVAASFAETAVFCESTLADRACPVCLQAPVGDARCGCEVPFALPSGPLDFTKFRANSVLNCGHFTGLSRLSVRSPEGPTAPFSCTSVPTLMATSSQGDPSFNSIAVMLQSLVLQERIGTGSVSRGLPGAAVGAGVAPLLSAPGAPSPPAALAICDGDAEAPLDIVQVLGDLEREESHPGLPPLDPVVCLIPDGRPSADEHAAVRLSSVSSTGQSVDAASCDEPRSVNSAPAASLSGEGRTPPPDARGVAKLERQRRNRLAATRSNARRKARREELEQNLEQARERERELLQKHAAVLACNAALKERAAQVWVSKMRRGRKGDAGPPPA